MTENWTKYFTFLNTILYFPDKICINVIRLQKEAPQKGKTNEMQGPDCNIDKRFCKTNSTDSLFKTLTKHSTDGAKTEQIIS